MDLLTTPLNKKKIAGLKARNTMLKNKLEDLEDEVNILGGIVEGQEKLIKKQDKEIQLFKRENESNSKTKSSR